MRTVGLNDPMALEGWSLEVIQILIFFIEKSYSSHMFRNPLKNGNTEILLLGNLIAEENGVLNFILNTGWLT